MVIKSFVKRISRYFLMFLFSKTRQSSLPKSIFFSSFSGKQYSDSPKAISEKIHALCPDVEIIWSVFPSVDQYLPSYIRIVRPGTIEAIRKQARANVWVFNNILQHGTYKDKKTLYIQTWHGERGFKRIGADAKSQMGKKYNKYKEFVEPKICNFFVTASSFGRNLYGSAFGFHGEFFDVGIPRNDCLVNISQLGSKVCEIRQTLCIPASTRVMMYAPTYRDHQRGKLYSKVDLCSVLDILNEKEEKWICLLRAHSLSAGIEVANSDDRFIDVTSYMDMADLLMITDLLITDYSSSAQDFLLTRKPVVLTQFDIEEYSNGSRSLYYDPMETGFLIAHTNEELMRIISSIDTIDHSILNKEIMDYYGMHETGNGTMAVCNRIIEWIK